MLYSSAHTAVTSALPSGGSSLNIAAVVVPVVLVVVITVVVVVIVICGVTILINRRGNHYIFPSTRPSLDTYCTHTVVRIIIKYTHQIQVPIQIEVPAWLPGNTLYTFILYITCL